MTKVWNVWWRKSEGSWELWRQGGILNRLDRVAKVGICGESGQWPLTRGAAGLQEACLGKLAPDTQYSRLARKWVPARKVQAHTLPHLIRGLNFPTLKKMSDLREGIGSVSCFL